MTDLATSLFVALDLIISLDPDLVEIVLLSLRVSLVAVVMASVIGLPLGAAIAIGSFPGRSGVVVVLNAMMGLPPVVIGLAVYLVLSRAGPLGAYGLLYPPPAMTIAQAVLITPIIAALTRQTIEDLYREYREQLQSLGVTPLRAMFTLLVDARYSLLTAVLAGFGRASAEVGAVIIVGGNINHVPRVMTTTIALETSKGNLALALGLGIVLLCIVIVINGITSTVQWLIDRQQG